MGQGGMALGLLHRYVMIADVDLILAVCQIVAEIVVSNGAGGCEFHGAGDRATGVVPFDVGQGARITDTVHTNLNSSP